jgi:hypothetical protein
MKTLAITSRDTADGVVIMRRNPISPQPGCLGWVAQRHKGGARRAGDSRGANHPKCLGEHSLTPL